MPAKKQPGPDAVLSGEVEVPQGSYLIFHSPTNKGDQDQHDVWFGPQDDSDPEGKNLVLKALASKVTHSAALQLIAGRTDDDWANAAAAEPEEEAEAPAKPTKAGAKKVAAGKKAGAGKKAAPSKVAASKKTAASKAPAKKVAASKAGSTKLKEDGTPKSDPAAPAIREWAIENGYDVPARGRMPADVKEAYLAAHKSGGAKKAPAKKTVASKAVGTKKAGVAKAAASKATGAKKAPVKKGAAAKRAAATKRAAK